MATWAGEGVRAAAARATGVQEAARVTAPVPVRAAQSADRAGCTKRCRCSGCAIASGGLGWHHDSSTSPGT